MKKLKKIIVSVLAMTLLMSVSAFAAKGTDAATIAEVSKQLKAAGVQQVYVDQVSTYLVDHVITQEQKDSMEATFSDIKAKTAGKTEVSDFTQAEISGLVDQVNTAIEPLGLYVLADLGKEKLVIQDLSGSNITTITKEQALTQKLALEGNKSELKAALQVAIDGYPEVPEKSEEPKKSEDSKKPADSTTNATSTPMKKTGTNNGNVLALGLGVLALAGAAFAVSKKVTA